MATLDSLLKNVKPSLSVSYTSFPAAYDAPDTPAKTILPWVAEATQAELFDSRTLSTTPGDTAVTAPVPLPMRTAPNVLVALPVPPLPTGSVLVTSDVRSTDWTA